MSTTLIETRNLVAKGSRNRTLFQDLNLCLSSDKVALVGRNGVGKSTLLNLLAGEASPHSGSVDLHTNPCLVPQSIETIDYRSLSGIPEIETELKNAELPQLAEVLSARGFSYGEKRKLKLILAKCSRAEMLLLDEPTEDLDVSGLSWLKEWLAAWDGGLLVATHSSELLREFGHFFLISESGCRYFAGDYEELERQLEDDHSQSQRRYLRNLNRLKGQEERTLHVARRRARKEQYGRCREIDRATPKSTLNSKRDSAQVSHGRGKRAREARLCVLRDWTRSTRRALRIELPLIMPQISLQHSSRPIVTLDSVGACISGRELFSDLDLSVGRQRLGIVGPNGAGKTTLLDIMLGHRRPDNGRVRVEHHRLAHIAQGGSNWKLDENLLSYLIRNSASHDLDTVAERLVAHKFPLALAERTMKTLSPGERVRAALIAISQRENVPELLLLDEPTYSLDIVGQGAMRKALREWPGGLVVVSHSKQFLQDIGIEKCLRLGDSMTSLERWSNTPLQM